jgi:predicted nucleotidyltransferase component of viral defense system
VIPKQPILDLAARLGLQPTTVEKDYALRWLLIGVAQHDVLSRWVFKGGTCLKKCFFETYRFSEDLDFTIPKDAQLSEDSIASWLGEIAAWVETTVGIRFPGNRVSVEKYANPRGKAPSRPS